MIICDGCREDTLFVRESSKESCVTDEFVQSSCDVFLFGGIGGRLCSGPGEGVRGGKGSGGEDGDGGVWATFTRIFGAGGFFNTTMPSSSLVTPPSVFVSK